MSDRQVKVWVQGFRDRPHLVLQWHDPDTGRRKSRSSGTADPKEAERGRADLEYELRHGKHQEASRMGWGRFRELYEAEYLGGARPGGVRHRPGGAAAVRATRRPGRLLGRG
jgi:hypothetical protein